MRKYDNNKKKEQFEGLQLPDPKNIDKVTQIQEFLKENYDIKINTFDNSKGFIHCKSKKYKFTPSVSTIWLHLMSEGISCSKILLQTILNDPNYIDSYNPIIDYFEALEGKFKGISHIDLLCDNLTARDFGDKDSVYYHNRLKYILRKWLVASVACSKGLCKNDVAIGFINSKGGIGKSKLIEFLVPEDLTDLYFQITDKNKYFDMKEIFSKFFLINFDEMNGISNRYPENFKSIMSQKTIKLVPAYEKFYKDVPRIGNAAFTSNITSELGGFLTENMGLRRFGCIEIDSINWKNYLKVVDINQIWAEAIMLLKQDFDFIWNDDDFNEFTEYNKRYLIETPIMNLLKLNYKIPDNGEGKFLTASEILQDLLLRRQITSEYRKYASPEKIGHALTSLGFFKKMGRHDEHKNPYYAYNIICHV